MRRPLGCWLVVLPWLLLAGACASAVGVLHPPVLDRDRVAGLLAAAEVAPEGALAGADPQPLRALFADGVLEIRLGQQRVEQLGRGCG
jgi:hypothetical protein